MRAPIVERWVDDHPGRRLLSRIIGRLVVSLVIIYAGGFSHSVPTGVVAAIGVVALLASSFTERFRPTWFLLPVFGSVIVCGALLNIETGYAGWVMLALAIVWVLGDTEIPLRTAIMITVAGGLINLAAGWYDQHTWTSAFWNSVAVVGMAAAGYSRRINRLRRASEEALVERSRQLEQRSLELIAQTEQTQAEAARVAALEERGRIAGDLHDLLAHSLGGLVVQLDATEALLTSGADTDQVAARLRASRRLAVDGLQDARAAVRELRTADREPPGAPVTVTGAEVVDIVTAVMSGPVGVQLGVRIDVVGPPRPAPAAVAEALRSVAREALTNINKHAPGGRVSASLIFRPESISLEVINSLGAGDDHELAGSGSGFGVQTMIKRMADVGGSLTAGRAGDDRWMVTAEWHDHQQQGTRAEDRV